MTEHKPSLHGMKQSCTAAETLNVGPTLRVGPGAVQLETGPYACHDKPFRLK